METFLIYSLLFALAIVHFGLVVQLLADNEENKKGFNKLTTTKNKKREWR